MPTTGIPALDDLVDGVRVGDNVVILAGPGTPVGLVGQRFVAAVEDPSRLVVAATEQRAVDTAPATAVLLDHRRPDGDAADLVDALAAADARVGEAAHHLIDSLTTVQARWGSEAALELFLATCPRLYRRGSVAMWLLDAEQHDRAFLERLREITQVVVGLTREDDEVQAEVLVAAGRPATTVGRRVRLRIGGDGLEAVGDVQAGRERLGELVRSRRSVLGLSQAELARRVDISPSALSQVERGVRGLAADTLIRIWQVLGVPFGPEDTLQRGYRISRRAAHRTVAPAPGIAGRELLDDPRVGRWLQLTIEPGASGRGPLFPGKAPELVLVLDGALDLQIGGFSEMLQEGDLLSAPDALVESWRNPLGAPTTLVWGVLR